MLNMEISIKNRHHIDYHNPERLGLVDHPHIFYIYIEWTHNQPHDIIVTQYMKKTSSTNTNFSIQS